MSEADTRGQTPCYVARCRCGCGHLVFASVDDPNASKETRRDTAKSIARLIREGFTVERMTVSSVRVAPWMCPNKGKEKDQRQGDLLEQRSPTP